MKKLSFLGLLVLLLLTACVNNPVTKTASNISNSVKIMPELVADTNAKNNLLPNKPPKILIAYFSRAENTYATNFSSTDIDANTSASLLAHGNTGQIAQYIQETIGGDIFSIVATESYPSDYEQILARVVSEKANNYRPKLKTKINNMDDYDVIFIGYPNWSYTCPMGVLTFLEAYDFTGKTIIPFCANGSGGLAESIQDISAKLPHSNILEPLSVSRFNMGSAKNSVGIWLNKLNINDIKTQ